MKCHDALIYPLKVLLCNSFFPHSPRVNTYPYMYCTFILSHVARHACRLRCPSSLVGSCLCLILPFFLYLQKASGFRVMVAISVAHLVLFLQKIYGIHICSSIGTGYSLQIKKFHFSPTILRLLILMVGLWLWGFISHEHFIYPFRLPGPASSLVISLFPQEFDGSHRGFDLFLQMRW